MQSRSLVLSINVFFNKLLTRESVEPGLGSNHIYIQRI